MSKTYQPFIVKKVDEIFEILKEDIKYSDFMKNRLCDILTKKFIDGELSSDDSDSPVFKNEEEALSFIGEALLYEDIKHLMEFGLVGYLDDDDEYGFFLTEKGKKYVDKNLLNK